MREAFQMNAESRPRTPRPVSLSHEGEPMRSRRGSSERLRRAVEALPSHTKRGMLQGIGGNRVIVGAYTDKRGGICPMLAAHRNGGRTDFAAFAKAWDAFTGAKRPRRASAREVRSLRGYLEAALMRDGIAPPDPSSVTSSAWAERPLAEVVQAVKASRRARAAADAQGDGVTIEELMQRAELASKNPAPENHIAANVSADEREAVESPASV
jgi:hypothetical protein